MSSPLSGVTLDSIGTSYDLAVGYDNGTTISMTGYVLAPGTKWTEATDIQDEQHLVQISSDNATDRFTRYPKVSQGDWSHGERQQFFVDSKAYYSSDGSINATVPGQLQLLGSRTQVTFADTGDGRIHAPIASDGAFVYVGNQSDATHNLQVASENDIFGTFTAVSAGDGSRVLDILGDSVYDQIGVYVALSNGSAANNGILLVTNTGATTAQMTNDLVQTVSVPAMCSLNANLFYATNANQIRFVPFATPAGNATGTLYFTIPPNEGVVTSLISTGTQMIFTTENGVTIYGIGNQTVIWRGDGTTTPARLGVIPGRVRGGGQVNGVVYLVVAVSNNFEPFGSNSLNPEGAVIYKTDGTTISIFDDLRSLDPVFQSGTEVAGEVACSCVGDGRFMFVSIPGLPVRVYDLATAGTPVFQYGPVPAQFGVDWGASRLGNILNLGGTAGSPISVMYDAVAQQVTLSEINVGFAPVDGAITMSWMDFGAPGSVKSFRQVEVELATPRPTGAGVHLSYVIDNGSSQTITLAPTLQGNLVGYFPYPTKGFRIQLSVHLSTGPHLVSPVVRSVSIKATLGRTWKCTVSCARNQRVRNQFSAGEDPQGLRAQDKLATILNAYQQVAGTVTLFVPSPTQSSGAEQVQATLEDYTWTASAEPGPYTTEYGGLDMEGTVDLTLVESL